VETEDCYSGNLRSPKDIFTEEMWKKGVNPATGPVFIRGARPGDILKVKILKITTRNYAIMCLQRGIGALADYVKGVETSMLPIRKGKLIVSRKISLPVRTMIGVIGTAPAGKAIRNGVPGEHGGNMDCNEITAGTSIYLPVNARGALLAAGDLHAVMGDGETAGCGAEVSGRITLKTDLLKTALPTPCVESEDFLYFIGSAKKLDGCEKIVLKKAFTFLTGCFGLKPNEAARMMSLAGDLQVCQVVDPLKTMRFRLPKSLFRRLGFKTFAGILARKKARH
jgi:amidase